MYEVNLKGSFPVTFDPSSSGSLTLIRKQDLIGDSTLLKRWVTIHMSGS